MYKLFTSLALFVIALTIGLSSLPASVDARPSAVEPMVAFSGETEPVPEASLQALVLQSTPLGDPTASRSVVAPPSPPAPILDQGLAHFESVIRDLLAGEQQSAPVMAPTDTQSEAFRRQYGLVDRELTDAQETRLREIVERSDRRVRDAQTVAKIETYLAAVEMVRLGQFELRPSGEEVDVQGMLDATPGATVMIAPGPDLSSLRLLTMTREGQPQVFEAMDLILSEIEMQREQVGAFVAGL